MEAINNFDNPSLVEILSNFEPSSIVKFKLGVMFPLLKVKTLVISTLFKILSKADLKVTSLTTVPFGILVVLITESKLKTLNFIFSVSKHA